MNSIQSDTRKLLELIGSLRGCMMVTFQGSRPHARPMYALGTNPDRYDGHLWFFTRVDSAKVNELRFDDRVLLTFAASPGTNYIAILGDAAPVHDAAKIREFWNIHAKAWFPDGPDDASLTLIRFTPHEAEYWEGPSKVSYMLSLAKAIITKDRVDATGKHGTVHMNS
jgi:general stress protein 26